MEQVQGRVGRRAGDQASGPAWTRRPMHNRRRTMSLTVVRRAASVLAAGCFAVAAGLTAMAAGSDNTWAPAGAFVEKLNSPIFALAVDPADGRRTLAGTATGTISL